MSQFQSRAGINSVMGFDTVGALRTDLCGGEDDQKVLGKRVAAALTKALSAESNSPSDSDQAMNFKYDGVTSFTLTFAGTRSNSMKTDLENVMTSIESQKKAQKIGQLGQFLGQLSGAGVSFEVKQNHFDEPEITVYANQDRAFVDKIAMLLAQQELKKAQARGELPADKEQKKDFASAALAAAQQEVWGDLLKDRVLVEKTDWQSRTGDKGNKGRGQAL